MALAPLPARLSSAKLELDRLNAEVNKFTVDTINHLKSLRLRIEGIEGVSPQIPLQGLADAAHPPAVLGGTKVTTVGVSPQAAHSDHIHRINTGPTMAIGGANSAGTGDDIALADHNHKLQETSGPTELAIAGILDGETWRRVGSSVVGRQVAVQRKTGGSSTSVVALADVPQMTTALESGRTYSFCWFISYNTAAAATGLRLAVNYTGTTSALGYTLMGANGLTAFQSISVGAADTLVGAAGAGPGANNVGTILYGSLVTTSAGNLVLRFASGVAASAVTINTNSTGLIVQQ